MVVALDWVLVLAAEQVVSGACAGGGGNGGGGGGLQKVVLAAAVGGWTDAVEPVCHESAEGKRVPVRQAWAAVWV